MQTTVQETDYYAILGVSQKATKDEIKRAWARKVREHPPERDPEGYKIIRKAYDTLSDDKARKEYDNLRLFGPEITRLTDEALMAMAAQDFSSAIVKLKRLLVLHPEAHEARRLLAHCFSETEDFDGAIQALQLLTQAASTIPRYHLDLGHAYLRKYEEQPEEAKQAELILRAREAFQRALDLDPVNNEPYLAISLTYRHEHNFPAALQWLERSINADQKVDFQDFDALFLKCIIHILDGKPDLVMVEAKRIESLVPDDSGMRGYVAAMFASHGFELLKLRAYDAAHYFLKAAIRFDPTLPELKNLQEAAEKIYNANQDWQRFEKDYSIIPPIKALAALAFVTLAGEETSYDKDIAFRNSLLALRTYPPSKVQENTARIRDTYKGIYELNREMWDHLDRTFASAPHSPSYASTSAGDPSCSPGCVGAIIGAIVGSLIFPGVGTFIGAWIGAWIGNAIAGSG